MAEQYLTHRLANGLEIVGQRMRGMRSVALGFQVNSGAKDDPPGRAGLAHLSEYVLFQGTERRSDRDLTEAFDALGIDRDSHTDIEWSRLGGLMLGESLDGALELFADVVRRPAFPDEGFERMRSVVLQEIRKRQDEPARLVFELLRRTFYGDSPLGNSILGTHDSVSAITVEEAREVHRQSWAPTNSLIAVAGAFDPDQLVAAVEAHFGDWTGERPMERLTPPPPRPTVAVFPKDTQQEHIAMAFRCVPHGHPLYDAAALLVEIFGGSMNSRLFREVREQRGLVYSVGARFDPGSRAGAVLMYAGTTPERSPETVTVMLEELKKLQLHGVTEAELERAKIQLKSELVMRGESTSARMRSILTTWWHERTLRTVAEVKARIEAVTTDSIARLLEEFPPLATLTIAALGPQTEEKLVGDALARS